MRNARLLLALSLTAAAMTAALSACGPASPSTALSGGSAGTDSAAGTSPAQAGDPGSSTDIDVCALLPATEAASVSGLDITDSTSSTIAPGQDQCAYHRGGFALDVDVIVYQPNSGVTWDTLVQVQQEVGDTQDVSGIGDKALLGSVELDVQDGTRLVAVEAAGGTLQGDPTPAEAIAKAIIAKL